MSFDFYSNVATPKEKKQINFSTNYQPKIEIDSHKRLSTADLQLSQKMKKKEQILTSSVDFNPYNYQDYVNFQKQFDNKKLGGIGPNVNSDEWKDKNFRAKKKQEFADMVKINNKEKLMFQPGDKIKLLNPLEEVRTERQKPITQVQQQNMENKHSQFLKYLDQLKNQSASR